MTKKETYLTCSDGNIYEGMTSISAIISKCEEIGNCQKINKVVFDRDKIKSKARELAFLKRKSQELGFSIEYMTAEEIDEYTTGNTHGGVIAFCKPTMIPRLSENLEKGAKSDTSLKNVKICGLMAIPPICEDPEDNRKYFKQMYKLFIDLKAENIDNCFIDMFKKIRTLDYLKDKEAGDFGYIGRGLKNPF